MFAIKTELIPVERIRAAIVLLRRKVMLDRERVALCGIPTSRFNEAVKTNKSRLAEGFAFQLARKEATALISQNAISKHPGRGGHRRLPNDVAMEAPMPYVIVNTRAVPLARKGDAHQGRVFYCPPGTLPVEEVA